MKSIFILTFQLFQISKLLVLSRSGLCCRWNHCKDCCIVSTRLRLSLFEWNKTENALQNRKTNVCHHGLACRKVSERGKKLGKHRSSWNNSSSTESADGRNSKSQKDANDANRHEILWHVSMCKVIVHLFQNGKVAKYQSHSSVCLSGNWPSKSSKSSRGA